MKKQRNIILFALCVLLMIPWTGGKASQQPASITSLSGQGVWGNQNGVNQQATYKLPQYATVAPDGTIYLADTANHLIRKISNGQVSTYAGMTKQTDEYGLPVGGYVDEKAEQAMFHEPKGLTVGEDGTLYVVDSQNGAVRKISPAGEVSTLVKGLNLPTDIVLGLDKYLYVSDTLNHRLVRVDLESKLETVAGGGYQTKEGLLVGAFKDGLGLNAQFNEPTGLAVDQKGNIIVADSGNQRIRQVSPEGKVTTLAGSGSQLLAETSYIEGGYQDGEAMTAKFNFPQGVDIAVNGTIYIADTFNHRLRALTPEGQVVTVAGGERHGKASGYEDQALFDHPWDVVVLDNQQLLIVDYWNHSVRSLNWYSLPTGEKNGDIGVIYNNNYLNFSVEPMIVAGRTMLPVREISEILGMDLEWDGQNKQVIFQTTQERIILKIGSTEIQTTKGIITMDTAALIQQDRTFVPLRFVAEAFGLHVTWLPDSRDVLLRTVFPTNGP